MTLLPVARLNIPDWELKMHRLQLNRMPAASEIQPHRDSGAYATVGHRLHVPLIVPTCVQFQQYVVNPQDEPSTSPDPGWRELPFKEGEAFEVNIGFGRIVVSGKEAPFLFVNLV